MAAVHDLELVPNRNTWNRTAPETEPDQPEPDRPEPDPRQPGTAMPAVVKAALEGLIGDGVEPEQITPEWDRPDRERDRGGPACLSKVPRDVVKNFPHTKRVGNYLVGKMINKGSFAKVMEGLHISTGEKVAIKVIDKKKAKQDSYVQKNMKREPRIHQMIRHPNVVQLLETLETENSYYMAMELCLGGDLMERICDRKRLEEREVRRYTRQILSAVEHLHRHGIVHRDLKIENFLLDENNNIKIVDFGLSNTLKAEALAQDLLNTQCGSPAYAAPELLAHRKYGPKVDVWSVGVSMFAMLTGTLPFTVEPFNIKQLHQKMVNGEISNIPADISKGASQFMLSLLEADPAKRPSVKAAMEEKWLNEGYVKRPLNAVSYRNRLQPDELNSTVLNYMSESLGYGPSEVVHTLVNNRPSSIMAAYFLLEKKLSRNQKAVKSVKERNVKKAGSQDGRKKADETAKENLRAAETAEETPLSSPPLSADAIAEDQIAITLENKDGFLPEVSAFAERELVHLSPPETSGREAPCSKLCESAPCDSPAAAADPGLRPALSENGPANAAGNRRHADDKLDKLQAFYSDKGASPRTHQENRGPAGHPETRFKDILQAVDEKAPPAATWRSQDRDGRHFAALEAAPLPRLRHAGPKDGLSRGVTWMGVTRHSTGGTPFLVHGSRPPAFPSARQHTLVIKSLRHSKERGRNAATGNAAAGNAAAKRNSVQLRNSRRAADLNLPLLTPAFQAKANGKSELFRMDFG
ncbi:hormonally up-regulated neu tumor-associated kinase homolog [Conger conger]|uniref:hormonally up-regulated neu tumor-associated kinase homolog n=1 Tax=Conger conger TaxID=82655 RepID=UPI002A5A980E|nr:hormonally up-regulated neu tumor-associated kinase homolog [Conger conger]